LVNLALVTQRFNEVVSSMGNKTMIEEVTFRCQLVSQGKLLNSFVTRLKFLEILM